jgi:hypothetical protein
MKYIRNIYKVARGVLFTAIILVGVVYLLLYVLLSIPAVQDDIKNAAEREVSNFLGSEVRIGHLSVKPFNEVVVTDLQVYDREGKLCLGVGTLGAGISLRRLINDRKIELTYGEIIGLDARIRQSHPDSALNIGFIIDAFKPKEKNKPPTKFDIRLRNVVLRRCAASFDKEWIPANEDTGKTDFNHLRVSDLKADINLPRLTNDDFTIDLRRISFHLSGGLDVVKIGLRTHITTSSISVENLIVELPGTEIRPSDMVLKFDGFSNIRKSLESGIHEVVLLDNKVSLPDFGWLLPDLRRYPMPLLFTLEAEGNMQSVDLRRFELATDDSSLLLHIEGSGDNLTDKERLTASLRKLELTAGDIIMEQITAALPLKNQKVATILRNCGGIRLEASGGAFPAEGRYETDLSLLTACGDLAVTAKGHGIGKNSGFIGGEVSCESFELGRLLDQPDLGRIMADVAVDATLSGKDINGDLTAYVADFEYKGASYGGIVAEVTKDDKDIELSATVDNDLAYLDLHADSHIEGEESWLNLQCDVSHLHPGVLGVLPKYRNSSLTARIDASLEGNNIDNVTGEVRINDLSFTSDGPKNLELDNLLLKAAQDANGRVLTLKSDWITGEVKGDFKVKELVAEAKGMFSKVFPSLLPQTEGEEEYSSDVEFDFTIAADNTLPEFLNLPFRLLVPVPVKGSVDGTANTARLNINVPYIQQGKNKLVRETAIDLAVDGTSGTMTLDGTTIFPAKKGEVALNLNIYGQEDNIFTDVAWETPGNSSFKGMLSLGAELSKNELSSHPEVRVDINPSVFDFGSARWHVDKGAVTYVDKNVNVDGLKIWHDNQFVQIDGVASDSPTDSITVKLASVDVDYIFDTLNINYVTFGGTATGEVHARNAFGTEPVAYTDNLHIEELSYNGTVLGDGRLRSRWLNDKKEVTIRADIEGKEGRMTTVDGGIWVTRDSLSFAIDADRVPVGFMQPFMGAFSSHIDGFATGGVKLFGTFSDIDLIGRVHADSLAMKLDYTNVVYHGSDSVFLEPGRIVIPGFRLYDRDGRSGVLSGELLHRYFHDPRFTFRVSDVKGMLCYDTNSKLNPDWYGTLYGDGSAVVRGWPGTVSISVDMTAVGRSSFTFVLNETQAAADYRFLTFTDRRKEEAEKLRADSVPDILESFRKKVQAGNDVPTTVQMDIRGSVTPSTLMTLVMDPVAGDKITARGNGNIQVDYDSESDEMQMFGKYILDEGNYNFSLQDLILRDFSIRQGSSISFNGDPMKANLDITAIYRVNTNLTDLDKSFATDRELARTNVPVDAVLMVDGPMQQPDISFDIELPTLTQDTERKVKSIISTDDMMSRQIIYLLALNRFYTPEYTGAGSNGAELASVASSTLSSQLSNMLGQLTDKFTVAPSFRSDKGDFSDIEVDVALSSRLLNNRLLINGNFGYRDPSTSTTTFIGDFDIEYLLSRNGNLRLKAYNHFNDQNYYLRQALTTQGIGVVYRRDFDNPFTFLKRRKKSEETDSIPAKGDAVITDTIQGVKGDEELPADR